MTSHSPIRIHVDHVDPLTRAGLSSALQAYPEFEIVQAPLLEAWSGIDVLATDLTTGLGHLGSPRGAGDRLRVLIVTTSDRECDVRLALKRGARGYVLQGTSLDQLAEAVREVFNGRVHLGTSVAQRLAESLYGNTLTSREEQVLRCVIEGLCNKEIAARLDLSVGTVKSHLRAVYAKLDVRSRTHAVAVAARRGLVQAGSAASASRQAADTIERSAGELLVHGDA